ncbi:MAG TPA: glycoside hydrolase family 5 protein [Bryobacteraceae bacterium]
MRFNIVRIGLLMALLGVVGAWGRTDPFAQNRRLGRGINIPGVFDRSGAEIPDPPMKAEYFKKIADAGFRNVRLVIRWSSYAQAEAPYTIDPSFLKKVDWAVEQSLANHLAVVLDFHYYPLISFTGTETSQEDPTRNRERFRALWEQVATHYRKARPEVMFGILNEPSRPNLGIDGWNALVAETLPLLRRTNPNRTILVQTANGGGFGSLDGLQIPDTERNVIVEVHNYDPGRFTHQQASWSANRIYKDIHWTATPEEKAAVDEAFAKVAAWGKKNNRPFYLGEFGAYQAADMPSRVRWTDYVARAAEKAGMSFAYWGFWRCGFDLYDPKTESWSTDLLKALVP